MSQLQYEARHAAQHPWQRAQSALSCGSGTIFLLA
jgi:hypothetical protein